MYHSSFGCLFKLTLFISGLLSVILFISWTWRSQVVHSSHCFHMTPTSTRIIPELAVAAHPMTMLTMSVNVVTMVTTTTTTTATTTTMKASWSLASITPHISSGIMLMITCPSFTLSLSSIYLIPLLGAPRLFGMPCLYTLPTCSSHPKVLQWGLQVDMFNYKGGTKIPSIPMNTSLPPWQDALQCSTRHLWLPNWYHALYIVYMLAAVLFIIYNIFNEHWMISENGCPMVHMGPIEVLSNRCDWMQSALRTVQDKPKANISLVKGLYRLYQTLTGGPESRLTGHSNLSIDWTPTGPWTNFCPALNRGLTEVDLVIRSGASKWH